jgi:hypothetical protein
MYVWMMEGVRNEGSVHNQKGKKMVFESQTVFEEIQTFKCNIF